MDHLLVCPDNVINCYTFYLCRCYKAFVLHENAFLLYNIVLTNNSNKISIKVFVT